MLISEESMTTASAAGFRGANDLLLSSLSRFWIWAKSSSYSTCWPFFPELFLAAPGPFLRGGI